MDSGLIYKVGDGKQMNSFRNFVELPDQEEFDTLSHAVDIVNNISLPDGRTGQVGRAAAEQIGEVDDVQILEDGITNVAKKEKVTKYTDFLYLPGSFLAVQSSSGSFATEVINRHSPVTPLASTLDLESLLEENLRDDDFSLWKLGFYGNHGQAENGVVHGSNVLGDKDFKEIFNSTKTNQLGFDYTYKNKEMRIFLAESGYVDVYQPSNFSTREFFQFVDHEIVPHLRII
ncbi:hypothetical protein [Haloarchaeobius sp. TZWWS8]|uniref:hypothetical protein n=1 Tax=Haloarchaeobius sp. TZWWS8 TaxID=3446121 RepID=UPI003EB97A67